MAALDVYEGVAEDYYRREFLPVILEGGETLTACAYVPGEAFSKEPGRPRDTYLNLILSGAREHGLLEKYIRGIQRLAAIDAT